MAQLQLQALQLHHHPQPLLQLRHQQLAQALVVQNVARAHGQQGQGTQQRQAQDLPAASAQAGRALTVHADIHPPRLADWGWRRKSQPAAGPDYAGFSATGRCPWPTWATRSNG